MSTTELRVDRPTADIPLGLPEPVEVWGLPLAPLTFTETLDVVERMIARGRPGYFITANLNYAMLSDHDPRLDAVNRDATFVVADGMPLVWASRFAGRKLPERVAGSDLIFALAERASWKAHRVFFLGGAPGVAARAADVLAERFDGLIVAGVESPPFRPLTDDEQQALLGRIRASRADLLLVAFGQPKGELWIHRHFLELGVPACVQLGASFDFVAGAVRRSPGWLGRWGLEWAHRMLHDPKRLAPRYAANAVFLARALLGCHRCPALQGSNTQPIVKDES